MAKAPDRPEQLKFGFESSSFSQIGADEQRTNVFDFVRRVSEQNTSPSGRLPPTEEEIIQKVLTEAKKIRW